MDVAKQYAGGSAMIPSDHFVRFYNEVFKALDKKSSQDLRAYWDEVGRQQAEVLAKPFRKGGLKACYDYWSRIIREENCEAEVELTNEYFEFRMLRCPSLSKVLDNDAEPFERYCEHCSGWITPVMEQCGLRVEFNIGDPHEPACSFRIYYQ